MKNSDPNILPTLLVVVMISVCSVTLPAQDSINRNALSISAGAAVPYSDFANSSFTWRSGFAKTGINLDAKLIHYSRRKIFGIYADAGYAYLFFNKKHYLAEYERIFDEGTTSVTTGGYHFLKAEVGFLLRLMAIRDTRIILQSGVGYTLCRHPSLSAVNSYWGVVNTVNSDLDLQLSGTAGVRVEHTLDEYTGIHLSYQLFACKPGFMDRESYRAVTFYLPVRIQNINFGLTRYF